MARILIGWELGAFRGHVTRILRYHDALVGAGHRVDLAVQRVDGVLREGRRLPGTTWQAPLWPRLLASAAARHPAPPATLGDILARLGLAEPGVTEGLVRAWEALLAAARPDVVVAEYAPLLAVASRGRVPVVAAGSSFDVPPPAMAHFPSLTGAAPSIDEAETLAGLNAGLAAAGRPALPALPALFAADRTLPAGLDELDAYAAWRPEGMVAPLVTLPLPPVSPAEEEELFVYWPGSVAAVEPLWQALARSALPVRLYAPQAGGAEADALARLGFALEPAPLPFAAIARRARLLLSHGGTGFVTDALLRGRPQVVVHADLEKLVNGRAVDRLGLGGHMPASAIEPEAFAAGLRTLHEDAALQARAQAFARHARTRFGKSAETVLAEMVAELA